MELGIAVTLALISMNEIQRIFIRNQSRARISAMKTKFRFKSFFCISNNTQMSWDVANARQVIGYEPEDDAEQEFAEEGRSNLTANGRTA